MEKKLTIAAAQLEAIPGELTKGICACAVNDLFLRGTRSEKRQAEKLLEEIDIDTIRKHSVSRMMRLMKEASAYGCDLVVFPELALTSFFPYFYIESERTLLRFFEKEPVELGLAKPLFECARRLKMSFSFGYAECAIDPAYHNGCRRYNSYILVDKKGAIYKYRKTHIPGFERPRPGEHTFQFEKGQFHASQEGYPVFHTHILGRGNEDAGVRVGMIICHDRRYNAPYLVMGMQKVDIILNGYNTPFSLPFARPLDKYVYKFHYLPLQAQAITEGTFIISVARAGSVFGVNQIAGTCIIDPNGDVLGKTESLSEELIQVELDLNVCEAVRAQKYCGDRLEPQVILKELTRLTGTSFDCSGTGL
ncbi:MAG TPA: nitrilase-related carbon-nitrogen hydrolase [Ktedonobacteraceae bacterium]|nr:nitrilase-related carbon-nitrogen hydrolase [Ktedonobacteraceae bacterium]